MKQDLRNIQSKFLKDKSWIRNWLLVVIQQSRAHNLGLVYTKTMSMVVFEEKVSLLNTYSLLSCSKGRDTFLYST